ncbi:hypothetical protein MANES_01G051367v8 [Manihot esculenta]|uniref:Uncharacterized protein n=1 Tax=Manihot esculenta TaxID=3983 RepID=A0ACB7IBR4_MANES|nr:hypothetical protein MANES_01G051367v8 [Manihot esculenta]
MWPLEISSLLLTSARTSNSKENSFIKIRDMWPLEISSLLLTSPCVPMLLTAATMFILLHLMPATFIKAHRLLQASIVHFFCNLFSEEFSRLTTFFFRGIHSFDSLLIFVKLFAGFMVTLLCF